MFIKKLDLNPPQMASKQSDKKNEFANIKVLNAFTKDLDSTNQ